MFYSTPLTWAYGPFGGFYNGYLGVIADPHTLAVVDGGEGPEEVNEEDLFGDMDQAMEAADSQEYTAEDYENNEDATEEQNNEVYEMMEAADLAPGDDGFEDNYEEDNAN